MSSLGQIFEVNDSQMTYKKIYINYYGNTIISNSLPRQASILHSTNVSYFLNLRLLVALLKLPLFALVPE